MKVFYIMDSRSSRVCMCQHAGKIYIVSHNYGDGCWTVRPFSNSTTLQTVSAEVAGQVLHELSKQKAAPVRIDS